MNDIKMTTGELAQRYGIKPHTISNWSTAGQITPAGKRGPWNTYLVSEVDKFFKAKHPEWRVNGTKSATKTTKSVIQMSLDSPLGQETTTQTGYMPISQVAELLKAMAR